MTLASLIAENIGTVIGTPIGLGIGYGIKPFFNWLVKRREADLAERQQTDEVALQLVGELREEIAAIRAEQGRERELCQAQLSGLRHEVNNYRTSTEMLLMGMELAPEKAIEIVQRVRDRLGPTD